MVGSYGRLRTGQTATVPNSVAKELVQKGMAEVVSENEPEPEAKKLPDHINVKGFEETKKQPSKPVLVDENSDYSEKSDEGEETELAEPEAEKAEGKKEITEPATEKQAQKEAPKKKYK